MKLASAYPPGVLWSSWRSAAGMIEPAGCCWYAMTRSSPLLMFALFPYTSTSRRERLRVELASKLVSPGLYTMASVGFSAEYVRSIGAPTTLLCSVTRSVYFPAAVVWNEYRRTPAAAASSVTVCSSPVDFFSSTSNTACLAFSTLTVGLGEMMNSTLSPTLASVLDATSVKSFAPDDRSSDSNLWLGVLVCPLMIRWSTNLPLFPGANSMV